MCKAVSLIIIDTKTQDLKINKNTKSQKSTYQRPPIYPNICVAKIYEIAVKFTMLYKEKLITYAD